MRPMAEVLARQPFFQDMAPHHLEALADSCAQVEFAGGTVVFEVGDAADHFYLVRRGRLVLEAPAGGSRLAAVQSVEPGEVVGWSWLVPPHRWRYRGRAVEDTQALAFNGGQLRGSCAADGALGYDLLARFVQVMAARLETSRRYQAE